MAPSTDGDCKIAAVGRWELCADESGVADTAVSAGLSPGSGIEFALEGGALNFYILVRGDTGALVRSSALNQRGFVDQPSTWTSGACHYWAAFASRAGTENGWTIERFEGPKAMLINGSLSYVPAK